MGIFNKFFKNKNLLNKTQTSLEKAVSVTNKSIQSNQYILNVHPDIRNYLWIGNGNYQNYVPNQTFINVDNITFTVSFSTDEEPSLIYLDLPISTITENVERPPYYPTYKTLTPEQRGIYWKLLANPYDNTIDIGYVFILYYGLERYLLTENYEQAIDIILKLRDVHNNKSFQSYSANAVILTCLSKQRADIVLKFLNSLNKDYEFDFSPDLYLFCKYSLNIPLTSEEIIRMAKSFEFTKTNYIKNYPDLFLKNLSFNISDKFKSDNIPWDKIITKTEFNKLRKEEVMIFANTSIIDKTIRVPSLLSSFKLKKNINDLLNQTHEDVKKELAELRKKDKKTTEYEKKPLTTKPNNQLSFDTALEKELLNKYNNSNKNTIEQHFVSIELQNFYYKYRELDKIYLQKCIEYCIDDILRLDEIQKNYKRENKNEVFNGNIPAFKRLAIIYEKNKEYEKAISVCEKAIIYYTSINSPTQIEEFSKRLQKLVKKR